MTTFAWFTRRKNMLNTLFLQASTLARIQASPMGSCLETFASHLGRSGYSTSTILAYLSSAQHFGRWLHARRIRLYRPALCAGDRLTV